MVKKLLYHTVESLSSLVQLGKRLFRANLLEIAQELEAVDLHWILWVLILLDKNLEVRVGQSGHGALELLVEIIGWNVASLVAC